MCSKLLVRGLCLTISLALLHGCSPPRVNNASEQPVLLLAVEKGNVDEARQLLDAGADVNMRGVNGDTALHVAAARGDMNMLMMLAEHGADFALVNGIGHTPADSAELAGMEDAAYICREAGGGL